MWQKTTTNPKAGTYLFFRGGTPRAVGAVDAQTSDLIFQLIPWLNWRGRHLERCVRTVEKEKIREKSKEL